MHMQLNLVEITRPKCHQCHQNSTPESDCVIFMKLKALTVFNKRAFFNFIPINDQTGALDRRGGDVALFISNCSPDSWRTNYLKALLPLLTKPTPHGNGLIMDSYGGCYPGFGIDAENNGTGWTLDQELSPGHDWKVTETLDLTITLIPTLEKRLTAPLAIALARMNASDTTRYFSTLRTRWYSGMRPRSFTGTWQQRLFQLFSDHLHMEH